MESISPLLESGLAPLTWFTDDIPGLWRWGQRQLCSTCFGSLSVVGGEQVAFTQCMPQSLITHKPWLQNWERKSRNCSWSPTWMWHLAHHQLQSEAHENGAGSEMEQQNPTHTHMETWDSGQASNSLLMLLVEGRYAGMQRSTSTTIRQLRAPRVQLGMSPERHSKQPKPFQQYWAVKSSGLRWIICAPFYQGLGINYAS